MATPHHATSPNLGLRIGLGGRQLVSPAPRRSPPSQRRWIRVDHDHGRSQHLRTGIPQDGPIGHLEW